MAWTETQLRNFHVAQIRAIEESRRTRARRAPEPSPVHYESDEEAQIAKERITQFYFGDVMGYTPEMIEAEKRGFEGCYRKLDDRL